MSLQDSEKYTQMDINFFTQCTKSPVNKTIMTMYLKSFAKWEFYRFCNILRQSPSKVARKIGLKFTTELRKTAANKIPSKK